MNKNEKMINASKKVELDNWAAREIYLAIQNEDDKNIQAYYSIALQAFCDVTEKAYDTKEPGIIKTILMQLLKGDPLTPITDDEEDWTVVEGFDTVAGADNPGYTVYQCKRRNTLFKQVTYDKKTGEENSCKYSDTGRAICIDINTDQNYVGGMGNVVLDEIYPITMPYYPNGKIKIFTEEFKYHKDSKEDSDTVGVLYFRLTNGQMVEAKRFFKDDPKTHQMVEIDLGEYNARKKKVMDKGGTT